jgi:protoporphyrinogen IX oxidase
MIFFYLKAVHIIFVVTWFAGLFYMPRLLVYITEAEGKPEPERAILRRQLKLMAKRLWYGIAWPSAVITLGMGAGLLGSRPDFLTQGFMQIKLALVFFLYLYHFSLHHVFRLLKQDIVRYSSQQLRIWNEVATLFLFSIVFIIVLRSALDMLWGLLGLLALTVLIAAGMILYKKFRDNE